MKKYTIYLSFLIGFLFISMSYSSCKAGYGCPAEEAYYNSKDNPKPKSTKRGKSKLFDKK